MKKTLLTLVLASVAASSYAATFYSDVNGSTRSSLNLFGDVYAQANKAHKTTDTYKADATGVVVKGDADKERTRYERIRVRAGLSGYFTDGTVNLGFFSRFVDAYTYKFNQARPHTGDVTPARNVEHKITGFNNDRLTVTVGHKQFGQLEFGKRTSVADFTLGTDLNGTFFAPQALTIPTTPTTFEKVFLYTAPKFVDGLNVQASFAKATKTKDEYTKQYGVYASYNLNNANKFQFLAAKTRVKEDGFAKRITDAYALGYVNTSVKDLRLGAEAQLELAKFRAPVILTNRNDKAWSVSAKAKYTVNQYFAPYAGVVYKHAKSVAHNTSVATKNKTLTGYVGVESKLYSYSSFNVNAYVEGVYSKVKTSTRAANATAFTKTKATTTKQVEAGLIVKF